MGKCQCEVQSIEMQASARGCGTSWRGAVWSQCEDPRLVSQKKKKEKLQPGKLAMQTLCKMAASASSDKQEGKSSWNWAEEVGAELARDRPLQLLTTLSKGRQRGPSSEHFFWSNWKLSSVVVAAAYSCTLDLLIVSVRCVAVSLASPNVSCSPSQSWLIAVEKLAQAPTTMLMMTAATTNSFHIFCCPTILLLVLGRNALFFHLQSKYTHIF